MALNRTRLPWSRGATTAETDAPFFDPDGGPSRLRARPDSPEASVFTPAEEAESHRRWRRAVLQEKLSGRMSGAEQLGLGLSAAALAALTALEERSASGDDADLRPRDASEEAGEVFAALKSAATGRAALKQPVSGRPAGPSQAFGDAGADSAFSTPVSNRADNGLGMRRPAPRGSGSPVEARTAGGAERADAAVLRKAEQAPTEARAPLPAEGASVAVRVPVEAEAVSMAMAIAMASDLPEAREDRPPADAKGANGAAAKVNQGQARAEASPEQGTGKDAPPPAAEVRADLRQGSVAEAPGRDKAGDAAPVAAVEAKATADQGRGGSETPSRAKVNDAAAGAVTGAGTPDRKENAPEAPVEAKAKDVGSAAGVESGLGNKSAKALPQAKAAEVEVAEAKAAGADRGGSEISASARTKDAPHAFDVKADATRQTAEAPVQTTANDLPPTFGAGADRDHGPASPETLGQAKTKDAPVLGKADGEHGRAAMAEPAKAPDAASANPTKAGQFQSPAVEATAPGKKVVPAFAETKADQGQRPTEAPPQQPDAKDAAGGGIKAVPGQGPLQGPGSAKDAATAPAAKTDPGRDQAQTPAPAKGNDLPAVGEAKAGQVPGGPAEAPANQGKAKDAPLAPTKADPGTAPAETLGQGKAKDALPAAETKTDPGLAETLKQAKGTDAPIAGPETKAGKALGGLLEVPADQTKPKDAPTAGTDKAGQAPSGPTDVPSAGQTKPKDAPAAIELKAGQDQRLAEPAKALPVVESKGEPTAPAKEASGAGGKGEPPGPAKEVLVLENKVEPTAPAKTSPATEGKAEQVLPPAKPVDQATSKQVPVEINAGQDQRPAEPSGPAKATPVVEIKAEQASQPAGPSDRSRHADSPTPANDPAQNGDTPAVAAPAVLPGAETLALHIKDLWPAGDARLEPSHTYAPSTEKAPVGLEDAQGKAALPPAAVGQPGGTLPLKISFGDEGGAGTPGRADAPPLINKDADAGPAGTKPPGSAPAGQDRASGGPPSPPPTDGGGGTAPEFFTAPGRAGGQAPVGGEPLAMFPASASDGPALLNLGQKAGPSPASQRHDPGTPALDGAWQYLAPSDPVLL